MLIHINRSSHSFKHQQRRIGMRVRAPTVQPDVDEVVGAADAEGAHVVHGGCPGVVVVAAIVWGGAGGGVGGEEGLPLMLLMLVLVRLMIGVWPVSVAAGASVHGVIWVGIADLAFEGLKVWGCLGFCGGKGFWEEGL